MKLVATVTMEFELPPHILYEDCIRRLEDALNEEYSDQGITCMVVSLDELYE